MKIKFFTVALLLAPVFSLAQAQAASTVDHYQLHFNSCSEELMVKACADNLCSSLYQEKAKLHVKANGSNLVNFNNFIGTESQSIKNNKLNYPFTMVVQSGGNGGNMDPEAENPLVCYVDGVRSCTVNKLDGNADNGSFTLSIDTAYAADKGPIKFSGNCLASNATVDTEFSFDSSASGFAGPVTISWSGNTETLNAGDKKPLTLPVSGATLSYPRADLLTLSARQMLPTGDYADEAVTDKVAFVPASWQVQNAVNCGAESGFRYVRDSQSCTVLTTVGNNADFGVAALDVNGDPLPLHWLREQVGQREIIQAALKHPSINDRETKYTLNDGNSVSQHSLATDIVGVVGITVQPWLANYIPAGDARLETAGDSQTIGRTVPASLSVKPIAGDIKDNVVYRAKPVEFTQPPQFEVIACAANNNPCKNLPSYTGEFAQGLMLEDSLAFSVDKDTDNQLKIRDAISKVTFDKTVEDIEAAETHTIGTHTIQLSDTSKLVFDKTDKKPSETILQQLKLSIIIKNDAVEPSLPLEGLGIAELDEDDTELRFGFLSIDNLELPLNTAGDMSVHLNYYGSDIDSIEQDIISKTGIGTSPSIFSLTPDSDVTPTGLEFNEEIIKDKLVKVPAHDSEWRGKVKMEVDNWLKPYENGLVDPLVNPSAELNITHDARKRGNDRIFNRREVVR